MNFTEAETVACCRLIDLAIQEDLGREPTFRGDITTFPLIPPGYQAKASFIVRNAGVVAGLPAAALVCGAVDPRLQFEPMLQDGASVRPGTQIGVVAGFLGSILVAERTALNFLQHLSGIATLTHRYVDAVAGLQCRILDTRKTTPGWRLLEKYAVRSGGGQNHRLGLFDGVLIKDNHLAFWRKHDKPAIDALIRLARKETRILYGDLPVEIELESLEQLDEALSAAPDIILLDNMTPEQMRQAISRRNAVSPGVLLEASGGITLANVRAVAETGVDRISVGALTHSAPALDIALDYVS
jgi:nicotinate-nucleotide pyrophosphorylase (carboxylating)